MTRYLSLSLGAAEPMFGQSIQELERAGGRPGADIRLSSEMVQQVRLKVAELGLDPDDTTGPELYHVLHQRLAIDEQRVRESLKLPANVDSVEVMAAVQKFIASKQVAGTCFALKASVAKQLIKKKPPKLTMKALNYRSLDSMLKHEPIAAIYAAAFLVESAAWQRGLYDQYSKLRPGDFEQRRIAVVSPKTKRWTAFSATYVAAFRQNILSFKELGSVVLLPIPQAIDGLAITMTVLSLYHMNGIRAYSSFIKLQQVKPAFGTIVGRTATIEPMTSADLAGQPVPWRVIQRYYGRMKNALHPDVFEPHVQPEDLQWRDAEDVLAQLHPDLRFWANSEYICALRNDEPVSLNLLDVALSYCNHLHFADRIVHYAREHLWHELMSRYLHQENLEVAVHQQLSRELLEPAA
jgi:hypothetical protein